MILAGGAWLLWWSGWLGGIQQPAPSTQTSATQQATSNTQPPTLNGMSQANDTSDAAVAQDTAAVDAQMQGLVSDSSSVDSSINDKPVSQAY